MSTPVKDLPSASDLQTLYKSQSVSDARAQLSQLVEQVAYSGQPVLLSKHDRPRVAIVPLDLLAAYRQSFLEKAAALRAKRAANPPTRSGATIPFEQVEGLSDDELLKAGERRSVAEGRARSEDNSARFTAKQPSKIQAALKDKIPDVMTQAALERALSFLDTPTETATEQTAYGHIFDAGAATTLFNNPVFAAKLDKVIALRVELALAERLGDAAEAVADQD